jgi:hypothetical protein
LREVAGGMLGLSGRRINHLPKEHFVGPNKCRKVEFFEEIYNNSRNIALFYRTVEFRHGKNIKKIVDSTTISLFKDILNRWKKSY